MGIFSKDNADAQINKGIALLNQGKYDKAIKAYDECGDDPCRGRRLERLC
jgi:hypothetical protein